MEMERRRPRKAVVEDEYFPVRYTDEVSSDTIVNESSSIVDQNEEDTYFPVLKKENQPQEDELEGSERDITTPAEQNNPTLSKTLAGPPANYNGEMGNPQTQPSAAGAPYNAFINPPQGLSSRVLEGDYGPEPLIPTSRDAYNNISLNNEMGNPQTQPSAAGAPYNAFINPPQGHSSRVLEGYYGPEPLIPTSRDAYNISLNERYGLEYAPNNSATANPATEHYPDRFGSGGGGTGGGERGQPNPQDMSAAPGPAPQSSAGGGESGPQPTAKATKNALNVVKCIFAFISCFLLLLYLFYGLGIEDYVVVPGVVVTSALHTALFLKWRSYRCVTVMAYPHALHGPQLTVTTLAATYVVVQSPYKNMVRFACLNANAVIKGSSVNVKLDCAAGDRYEAVVWGHIAFLLVILLLLLSCAGRFHVVRTDRKKVNAKTIRDMERQAADPFQMPTTTHQSYQIEEEDELPERPPNCCAKHFKKLVCFFALFTLMFFAMEYISFNYFESILPHVFKEESYSFKNVLIAAVVFGILILVQVQEDHMANLEHSIMASTFPELFKPPPIPKNTQSNAALNPQLLTHFAQLARESRTRDFGRQQVY